jgi:carbon-monoxide dehydrogenase small subunit
MMEIGFVLNDRYVTVPVEGTQRLLAVLRDTLGCTEVKEGCGEGECGACTVLLDGRPVPSCSLFAFSASGRRVTTVKGLARSELERIRDAMVTHGAVQCGFCTPGFVLSIKALLDRVPCPTREQVREALAGNLCRCTGYEKIFEAVEALSSGVRP